MGRFSIKWNDNSLDWDSNYGIDNRTGWSVAIRGSYLVQFEKYLIMAIIKAARKYYEYKKDNP